MSEPVSNLTQAIHTKDYIVTFALAHYPETPDAKFVEFLLHTRAGEIIHSTPLTKEQAVIMGLALTGYAGLVK